MSKKYNVAISGVQGYIGKELVTLVINHPHLQLVAIHSRQEKAELYQQMPTLLRQNIPIYSLAEMSNYSHKLMCFFWLLLLLLLWKSQRHYLIQTS